MQDFSIENTHNFKDNLLEDTEREKKGITKEQLELSAVPLENNEQNSNTHYSKSVVVSQDKQESLLPGEENDLSVYEKTQGVEDHGKEYEKAMCVLYALKLVTNDAVDDFRMTTNNNKYDTFDDIELDVMFKNGTKRIFLFQLKYNENRKAITQKMLTKQAQPRDNKQQKSKFFIPNYLGAISKLNTNGQEFVAVLYTNKPVEINNCHKLTFKSKPYLLEMMESKEIENKSLLLNTQSEKPTISWFKPEFKPQCDTLEKEELQAACQRFFIFSEQDDLKTTRENVKKRLRNLLHCDIYNTFVHFMQNWWSDNFVLTKHHVTSKLTELALSPYIQTISDENHNQRTEKLARAIKTFELTIVEPGQEKIVTSIWSEISKDHDWKSLRLYKSELTSNMPLELQKAIILWYWNKVPLLVKLDGKNEDSIKSVLNLMERNNVKKQILLLGSKTKGDFEGWNIFETLFDLKEHGEIYEDIVSQFNVSLQGKKHLSLKQLTSTDQDISTAFRVTDLLKMSQTECLLIGDHIEKMSSLYKPRIVSAHTANISDVLNKHKEGRENVIIFNCNEVFKNSLRSQSVNVIELSDFLKVKSNQSYEDSVLVSTTSGCTGIQFDQVCDKFKSQNVYVFQVSNDDSCLLLQKRESSLKFFSNSFERREIEENHILFNFTNPLNVVCAPPGMGKSSLLTALSNKCSLEFWTVRIELIHYNAFLKNNPYFEKLKSLFLGLDKSNEDPLTARLKKILFKNKKMLLFLDGLDEVDSGFVENVTDFAKHISSEVRVWILSRENLRQELIQTLHVVPIEIEELGQQQQKSYLREKLENNYQKEEIDQIIEVVYKSADINGSQDLLGIPLQLHLITEMFLNNEDAYKKIDQQNLFVLTHMYKLYFEGIVKTCFQKLNIDENLQRQLGIHHEQQLKKYELPALKSCLDNSDYEKLHLPEKKVTEFLETKRSRRDIFGIIKSVNEQNETVFYHQTYAEYFACCFFKKRKDKIRLLSDSIFLPKYNNLRRLFDVMLAENNPLHLAVIYKSIDQFNKHFGELDKTDEGDRTVLHLACSYGMQYPEKCVNFQFNSDSESYIYRFNKSFGTKRELSFYLKIMEKLFFECRNISERDSLFNFNCVSYANHSRCLYPIEKIVEKKLIKFEDLFGEVIKFYEKDSLTLFAAQLGYPHLLSELIKFTLIVGEERKLKLLFEIAILGHPEDECLEPRSGNIAAVELLLALGVKAENNIYLLDTACKDGRYDMISLLVREGFTCLKGTTILHCMLERYYLSEEEAIKVLSIAQNCDVDVGTRDNLGRTPLHIACSHGQTSVVKSLLERDVEPNSMDKFNRNLLHSACFLGKLDSEIICLLIKKGVDINQRDVNGETPLHVACRNSNIDVVKLLLDKGADRNIKDNENNNLLHHACRSLYPQLELVRFLIEEGSDVNDQNTDGKTALHHAAFFKNSGLILLLLEKKANPNIKDYSYRTALHVICAEIFGVLEKLNAANLLIQHDIDVDAQDKFGTTALQLACESGSLGVVKMLIAKGVDPYVRDDRGKNALDYASQSSEDQELCKLLLQGRTHSSPDTRNKQKKRANSI